MARMNFISRSVCMSGLAIVAVVWPTANRTVLATLPQAGDIAFGLSQGPPTSDATQTLELVRGTATMGGGVKQTSPWQTTPFIEVVKFDNLGGIAHNAHGNVLGVNFGASANAGGQILSLGTTGTDPAPDGQLIVDTGTTNVTGMQIGGAVTTTRLGELAVSPDNTRILATGYDSGTALVYNYTPGNAMGTGTPAATGGREGAIATLPTLHTQGVAWKDNNTGLVFSSFGDIYEVNPTTAAMTLKTTVEPSLAAANFTSLAYNPSVSPYIYALYGAFVSPSTINKLYVLNANNYSVVKQIDLSTSLQTGRDIALDKNGNLFMSQYGGTGTAGASIDFLPAANVLNPATLTNNSSVDWYTSTTLASFSGLDIGFGPTGVAGDYNGNGIVDTADYTTWRDHLGQTFSLPNRNPLSSGPISQSDYDFWKSRFGATSGAGSLSSSAVPEPTSLALLVIGLAGAIVGRRCFG
jgi:PEP-CTERM motif-containing protein